MGLLKSFTDNGWAAIYVWHLCDSNIIVAEMETLASSARPLC